MTINVPNPEALRAGIRHAEEHLSQWHQGTFVSTKWDQGTGATCGTTACLAGHILLAKGLTWQQLWQVDIPAEALRAIGLDVDSAEGGAFEDDIFYMVEDGDGDYYAKTAESFAEFKANVTELTGVEL